MQTDSPIQLKTTSQAGQQWQDLRRNAAQPQVWLTLARLYAAQQLPWQAEYAARQALRLDPTLAPTLQALGMAQWQQTGSDTVLGRAVLPDAAALAQRFAAAVDADPGDWLSWLYLARLQDLSDPQAPAESLVPALQQARALEPLAGESLHWLGVWRLHAGAVAAAISALSGLLDIRPVRHGSMMYLGEALLRSAQTVAAEKAFARAALSNNPEFLLTLAARVYAHNYWQEAIDILHKVLAIRPAHLPALLALARIQSEVYALADCRATLAQIARLAPDHVEAGLLQAGLLGRMGDAQGHLRSLHDAYQAGGDPLSRLASSIAMTALYQDQGQDQDPAQHGNAAAVTTATAIATLHRDLCAPIEAAVTEQRDFANLRSSARRLRIGFVTGDLHRQHPVNIFMLPMLQQVDHAAFELCIYFTGTMHDVYTRQAQECAARWLEAAALDDAALQAAIVADGVDILIDLAGHTATHRLGVFALRAAPVQASFLGYPHSTGLTRIDWLIGDATVTPARHAHLFSEGLAQLPGSVFCWASVDDYPLPRARPASAPLVLGSFNNAMKLSPRTIALWARVLQAVPDAVLLLKAPSLGDAAVQERMTGLFGAHGIPAARLQFDGPSGLEAMMQQYGAIDIGLDPLPYNGGTTTLQALWMGVPVVTLEGGNFASRMGASFLRCLGRTEWLATDEAGYVAAVVALAAERAALRSGRAALRAQMAASPLCDISGYMAGFADLLQRMWATHCAEGRPGHQPGARAHQRTRLLRAASPHSDTDSDTGPGPDTDTDTDTDSIT